MMQHVMVKCSGGSEVAVNHDEGWSGLVVFAVPNDEVTEFGDPVLSTKQVSGNGAVPYIEVTIDMTLLKGIVASWLRNKRIEALEDASDDDVLEGLV